MVEAYHAIWGCYGFWLPNDPWGSWSRFVRSYELYAYGPATKVATRRSLADRAHDPRKRQAAKAALKWPPMRLTGEMAKVVGTAFGGLGLTIHALAVMPDHMHAVLGRSGVRVEQRVRQMKQAGTVALREAGWVEKDRPVWVRSGWFVYLNDATAVRRAVRYVEENPVRARLRRQRWSRGRLRRASICDRRLNGR